MHYKNTEFNINNNNNNNTLLLIQSGLQMYVWLCAKISTVTMQFTKCSKACSRNAFACMRSCPVRPYCADWELGKEFFLIEAPKYGNYGLEQ